ncbi:hypothetical protein O181_099414 [Austropuccinia psidii MF-1]|uniref:Reverse transcriptase RNase H-like domain-containing protein n=1 Tax=Austropuccinia psidii MF-1 TaxID=1389203 RepID=A0A9Q3PFF6_9BASI|nr:hypothetical protein [Austropuccinia psidii MF-1]
MGMLYIPHRLTPMLKRPPYQESLEARKEIKNNINELLEMDVIIKIGHNEIVEITTPVLITWHGEKSRLCGVIRALNNYTTAYRYPLPRIPCALGKLAKAKYITKMDCMNGFDQNVVKTNPTKLLRIICLMGIYEYTRMPFGIKNASAHFQKVLVLGHKVLGLSLAIDQKKVEAVLQKASTKKHQRDAIFPWLCSKDVVLEITKEKRDAYERIKYELKNAPVLILPDFELPFKLYIDAACTQGLGAALHQSQIMDGEPKERVIWYISRQLKDSRARYGTTQTECLFLVWALEKLHYYLEGAVFEVYTDCTALKSLLKMKTTNRHMLRWQTAIQEYRGNMTIIYKEGKGHTNTNGLRR